MLRTLIVDDEAPARARLRRMLQPFEDAGRVAVVGEAADGVEALETLEETPTDLLLLDIQMPELSGFDVLDRLGPEDRPLVVFTTAFDEYALQAFEAAAVDYLLKPISEERLDAALARAERLRGDRAAHDDRLAQLLEYLDRPTAAPAPPAGEPLRQLSVPVRDRLVVVPVEKLLSAEVQDGITRLYVLDQQDGRPHATRHLVSHTLDALEARLDPHAFMRVHRAALVHLDYIREMVPWFSGRYKLVLETGHEVIASRARSRELKDRLSL